MVELAEQLGGRLSACTGLKLDLPTVCHYSVPVKEGGKKEANDRVQVKQGESGTIASQWRGDILGAALTIGCSHGVHVCSVSCFPLSIHSINFSHRY